MKQMIYRLGKAVLILIPVAAAVAITVYFVSHKPGPAQKQVQETVQTLRVIPAPVVDLVPRAEGYGVAEPVQVWEAVAEVKGRVTATHPTLQPGQLINKDSLLVRIDPTEYRLAVIRLEAVIAETRAKMAELNQNETNLRQIAAIETQSLELSQKMLERKQKVVARNAVSQDAVDREEKSFLAQKQALEQRKNTLALIPPQRRALQAALDLHQADLKQAQIDLEKTRIHAPFDCRLADVAIEPGQFVGAGQALFKAHGIDATQINARFRMETLRNLLGDKTRGLLQPGLETGIFTQLFAGITATVTLENTDWSVTWEARIDRLRESVAPETREIQVMVVVDRPYENAIPGKRPPLMPGMFCHVALTAPARPGQVVLPRTAVHGNSVFLVGPDNRLEKQPVTVAFAQSEFVVIASGLSGTERVVVSDPAFAITGMKVRPVMDDDLVQRLEKLAQAEGITP
ncbi:MAG: efflux RND transporter periplasmic adaptor subunit [Desulfotignum sp.]|nr:efflux RND transporter periplasmic adaptor subunit [Desulfotignum sp.]